MITPDEYLDFLRTDIEAVLATPRSALGLDVGACPGWKVRDLLGHHAGVFRFATAQLRAEPGGELATFDPPSEDVDPLDLFSFSADELLAELVAVDPTEHRPNWLGAPTAAFYWRRMAQETAIHRFDAQSTHCDADPIDPRLAVDGIDELCEVFLPHAKRRGITGDGESVHLHATDDLAALGLDDDAGEWMFTFTADGVETEHSHGKGDMAGRGTASDLLLFAWNRRPVDVTPFGDTDLLAWWPATVRL